MKKIFFIAAMLMAFASHSFANVEKPFISGIQLTEGLEFATGEDSPDIDQLKGMRIYMAFSYNALIAITPELAIHPGIGFNFRITSESDNGNYSDYGVSYSSKDDESIISLGITVPVMARYYFTNIFFGELGVEAMFNFFEKYSYKNNGWEDMENANSFNVGITGGLGVTLFFGLEFNLNFTYGITDLYKQKRYTYYVNEDYYDDYYDNYYDNYYGTRSVTYKTPTWSYMRINFNIGYWFGYKS